MVETMPGIFLRKGCVPDKKLLFFLFVHNRFGFPFTFGYRVFN